MDNLNKLKSDIKVKQTMVRLPKELVQKLKEKREYSRETYAETIRKLIKGGV